MVTYDPIKRLQNIKAHGIDFAELHGVLDHQILTEEDQSEAYGERRMKSLCWFNGRLVVVVWTYENEVARLISCRRSTKHEKRKYLQTLGRQRCF